MLFIMSLKEVKRFLRDSMKSASPLFSYSLRGERRRRKRRSKVKVRVNFMFHKGNVICL